ncbi:calcium/sodium antiporter [uncultured Pseudokineococcus sp.]|uniref:calcium/sodium antiporter n=1 Tax=uncultured Pseudokineococcus sp. TaxID=1642928 RepID=UPI0026097C30|nr:calcium/sodium antiporter [uncultured Pseudokineococcus sp.]
MLAAQLVLGFVLLVVGGELLVRGGGGLARAFGLSPLVVGLTVVAAATSAPEFAVTLMATLDGAPGLAVGNVVGSNIANVLLILGISALALPLPVGRPVLRVDMPVVVGLSVLALLLALDGSVGRLDGGVLLLAVVAYLTRSVVASRREERAAADALAAQASGGGGAGAARPRVAGAAAAHGALHARGPQAADGVRVASGATAAPRPGAAGTGRGRLLRDAALLVAGIALLVAGSQLLVGAASTIAADLGVSDLVVGLTVVAVGTSLPELATSVIAVVRGERDLAIGNVVGSNIFNVGAVLGLTGLLSPGGVPVADSARAVDLPVMVAAAAGLLVLALLASELSRGDGALLLAAYGAYLGYLVLDASGSTALGTYLQAVAAAGVLAVVAVGGAAVLRARRGRP